MAIRCSTCGNRNDDGAGRCSVCNANLRGNAAPPFLDQGQPQPLSEQHRFMAGYSAVSQTPVNGGSFYDYGDPMGPPVAQSPTHHAQLSGLGLPQGDVVGRVIASEAMYQEEPDFDKYRFFTKLLWGLMLAPCVLAVAIVLIVMRALVPINLFSTVFLAHIFSPFRRKDIQVPVRHFRVRTEDGSEVGVRLKGVLAHGSIGVDDTVSFWGTWRDGTLCVQRAYNHRTNQWIAVQQPLWKFALYATLAFLLFLFLVSIFTQGAR